MNDKYPPLAPLEDLFVQVPPPEAAVNEEWAKILDWDTTPFDLRAEDRRTLKAFCEWSGIPHHKVNKIRKEETYLRARRKMAQDRGLLNHQCFTLLEALYAKALGGDVAAIKEWAKFYPEEMAAIAAKSPLRPSTLERDPAQVGPVEDLDTDQIETLLAQLEE